MQNNILAPIKEIYDNILKELGTRFMPRIYIYELDTQLSVVSPLYRESVNPVYKAPLEIPCNIVFDPTETQLKKHGLDNTTNAIIYIARSTCQDSTIDYAPKVGDKAIFYNPMIENSGIATFTNNSNIVTGNNTSWLNLVRLYDRIKAKGDYSEYYIDTIDNDTTIKLKSNFIAHDLFISPYTGVYEIERPMFFEVAEVKKSEPFSHAGLWFHLICALKQSAEDNPQSW